MAGIIIEVAVLQRAGIARVNCKMNSKQNSVIV